MKVNIKKLRENATIPARGSASAAGCDLYACLNHRGGCTIQPNQTVKVNTGITVEIAGGVFRCNLRQKRARYQQRAASCKLCWRC